MNSTPIHERIEKALASRHNEHLFRTIPPCAPGDPIDLSTNSYLNLHVNSEVSAEAARLTKGHLSGNCASRLVAQMSPLYEELEKEIAEWKKAESALVFNSGYTANTGILQALCTRDTEVFSDRLNHASLLDGVLLSGARLTRYRHNDMHDLRRCLERSGAQEKLIVTDTVFSMDGDRAALVDICDFAAKYGAMIMADEAHATGVFGEEGAGLAAEQGFADRIDIRMGTLSKAVAGVGGFFAGSSMLRDYLVNCSRSLIYSTGLPHSAIAFDLASVRHIRKCKLLGNDLISRANAFREAVQAAGFDTMQSDTQIVPLFIGEAAKAIDCSSYLSKQGIRAPAIRPPTVPKGTARVRLSFHSGLTDESTGKVLDALATWIKGNG